MSKAGIGIVVLFALAGLVGCGSSGPVKSDRFYRLDPPVMEGPAGAPIPATLMVNDLATRGFLGSRAIPFRTREDPLVAQRYDDLLWEEPPARALARALVTALRAARVFAFVVVSAERARPDYLLGGALERFEHLPTDQPPRVAATFQLALVRADDRGVVAIREYRGEEPVDADTPDAMIAAFNRLSARLAAAVVRDLRSAKPRLHGGARP